MATPADDDAPVTATVPSMDPGRAASVMSATCAASPPSTTIDEADPSTKPTLVAVSEYVPAGTPGKAYPPAVSVCTEPFTPASDTVTPAFCGSPSSRIFPLTDPRATLSSASATATVLFPSASVTTMP